MAEGIFDKDFHLFAPQKIKILSRAARKNLTISQLTFLETKVQLDFSKTPKFLNSGSGGYYVMKSRDGGSAG